MNRTPSNRLTSRRTNTKTMSSLFGSIVFIMTIVLHQEECCLVAAFTIVSTTTSPTTITPTTTSTTPTTTSTILQYANDPPESNTHFRQAFESLQQSSSSTAIPTTDTNNHQTPEIPTLSSFQLPPITNKHQQAWNDKYLQLVEYYQHHGHSNVPSNYPSNPALSTWVLHQRQCAKKKTLTVERTQALEALQFQWNTRTCWETRYQQLVEYKHQHGNCFVPTHYPPNPQLGRWLANQKQHYRMQWEQQQQQQDVDSLLPPKAEWISPTRIQKLIDIGAIVVMENEEKNSCLTGESSSSPVQTRPRSNTSYGRRNKSVRDIHWYQRYQELVQYQLKHGHCHVPRRKKRRSSDNTSTFPHENEEEEDWTTLGNWVDTQRTNYRALMKNQSSPMTLERQQLLEQIGFFQTTPLTSTTTTTTSQTAIPPSTKKQVKKSRKTSPKKSNKTITQGQGVTDTTTTTTTTTTTDNAEKTLQSTISVYSGKPPTTIPPTATIPTTRRSTTTTTATVQNWSKRRIVTTTNNNNPKVLRRGNTPLRTSMSLSSSGTTTMVQEERTTNHHHPFVTIEMTNDEKLAAWRNRFKELQ